MNVRRKRCPICDEMFAQPLREHIEDRHFPKHCTVCDKTEASHEHTDCSPTYTLACEGGEFTWRRSK